MADRTHPFPEFEPEVSVRPRPDAALHEILRTDLGGGFVPLEVGAETKWSFYDWPERNLTNVSDTRVSGYVRFRGERLLSVYDTVIFGEDSRFWSRWIYRWQDETLVQVLAEDAEKEGDSKIREVDSTPEPLRLRVGLRWQGHEVSRCGDEVRGEGDVHHGLIDGPFEVTVPAGTFLCLRENWWNFDPTGVAIALAELYVAGTGRSIYWKRYNGPKWGNYETLGQAGVPEREHDGVLWRLYYECLPDIAL